MESSAVIGEKIPKLVISSKDVAVGNESLLGEPEPFWEGNCVRNCHYVQHLVQKNVPHGRRVENLRQAFLMLTALSYYGDK